MYLDEQIITYLGNKRKLLSLIEKATEPKNKICLDLFSGSGVVSRLFKEKGCSKIIANDLETYSYIINSCYLSNQSNFDIKEYNFYLHQITEEKPITTGPIYTYYAPKSEKIKKGERCFYTPENAILIDTYRTMIEKIVPQTFQKYFIAPLLYEASVHTNTSGVFKGFYKNKDGIGQWGGEGKNALSRICGTIHLNKPVFSTQENEVEILQYDATKIAHPIKCDIAYLDPPYNQHPYGSNYFMLNLIAENKIPEEISQISGIPKNWNRSSFNKKATALEALKNTLNNVTANKIIISYNNEGFISYEEMVELLQSFGEVEVMSEEYPTFRGCRNLSARAIHTTEYLFCLR